MRDFALYTVAIVGAVLSQSTFLILVALVAVGLCVVTQIATVLVQRATTRRDRPRI